MLKIVKNVHMCWNETSYMLSIGTVGWFRKKFYKILFYNFLPIDNLKLSNLVSCNTNSYIIVNCNQKHLDIHILYYIHL